MNATIWRKICVHVFVSTAEDSSQAEVIALVPIQVKFIFVYYFWYLCILGMN